MGLSRTQTKRDIREFVMARKAAGESVEAITMAAIERWPDWKITQRGVHRMNWDFKIAWDGDGKTKSKPHGGTCLYKWLEGGQLHQCSAEGYPHCANHRNKTAPAGSKFPQAGRVV